MEFERVGQGLELAYGAGENRLREDAGIERRQDAPLAAVITHDRQQYRIAESRADRGRIDREDVGLARPASPRNEPGRERRLRQRGERHRRMARAFI